VLILAVDTSTMVGGVALINDGALLGEHVLNVRATHSERLMSSVDATLTGANIAPGDLDAIACGVGPGSFTGVRIGVSAAKGMSYALGIPLVGVPTLDALAYGRSPGFSEVWSMIDARHGRCYVACYKPSDSFGAAKRILDYSVLDVSQIVDSAGADGDRVLFVGDGALAYSDSLLSAFPGRGVVPPAAFGILRPAQVGMLGMEMLEHGEGGDPAHVLPIYLRPTEAEVKLSRKEMEKDGSDSVSHES
jgi:tRNA threonylcarbamoyladenosine biosynthesis protein TsaB